MELFSQHTIFVKRFEQTIALNFSLKIERISEITRGKRAELMFLGFYWMLADLTISYFPVRLHLTAVQMSIACFSVIVKEQQEQQTQLNHDSPRRKPKLSVFASIKIG